MKQLIYILILVVGYNQATAQVQGQEGWDLARCLNYAVSNNITVKQKQLDQQTAEANYLQSRVARLPSISATGSQSLTHGTSADPITYEYISQTIHATSASVNGQVTLYNGSKLSNTIKQNKLLVDQNSYYVQAAQNDITLSVTQAFLQALYYHEGVRIAEANLKASLIQVDRAQALFDAGSSSAKDLADVKSQYATDQYTLVSATNSYAQQVLTLKQLLEMEPEQSFELKIPVINDQITLTIPDKYEVYKKALEQMPEIKSSQLQRDINQVAVTVAKAGYRPTLSLSGSLNSGYTNTQTLSFREQFNNNYNQRLGLSLNIPIFSNLKNRTSVQTARINILSSELTLTSSRKALYKKIENAHQSAIAAQSEMQAATVQVETARVAYDLAQQQYNVGSLNTVSLLIDQNTYLTAQQKYIQTKYTTILYYQLLQFYQGNSIEL